jgi:hypothetical protein
MIWGGISQFGKTNLVAVNGTPNLQTYFEGIVVPEVVPFINKITLNRTSQDKPKTLYGRTILMNWNDPQGRLISHQWALCRVGYSWSTCKRAI